MATKDPKDEAKARLEKQRSLKTDLSGALMSGRIAARTETRVRVAKQDVDDQDTEAAAATIPRPAPTRPPAQPPTGRRGPPTTVSRQPIVPKKAPPAPAKNRVAPKKPDEKRVAWDPKRLVKLMAGALTLGELEGITKEEQYKMAELGHRNLEAGKLKTAQSIFDGLAALDPRDAYFHLALGAIAQRQDRLEEAERAYSRSIEINPYSAHALANRGEVRMLLGRMVEGAKDLLRALDEDPDGKSDATRRARATISVVMDQLDGNKKSPSPRPRGAPRAVGRRPIAPRRGSPAPRRSGRPGRPRR